MNPEVEKKVSNFRNLCVTLCEDPTISNVINMMDTQMLYNMVDDLYLKLNMTQEQAYTELSTKLKFTNLTDEQSNKVKRYIEYFYELMKQKYADKSYEELLKLI